jgi:hypothetical protein
MLALNDSRWATLSGGYRVPYDPRPALERLASNFLDRSGWQELWGELHHQGDVGEASYAAVPHLVHLAAAAPMRDWNVYALAATIETERHRRENPALSIYLSDSYNAALQQLVNLALSDLQSATDPYVVRSALAVVALGRGQIRLGAMIAQLDDSDIDEFAERELGWSRLYRDDVQPPSAV